tara:strand:- start:385 stop:1161 length:777 start_codon:yes stop_codon:yes gene_type:complete
MIKIIMEINSFWISTTPRTGSMWLYNVTREILKFSKMNILPIKIPKYDAKFHEIFEKQSLIDQNNSNKYVFKIHRILKPNLPRSKILTTIRDPRDICISFKEFMRTDFDTALKASKTLLKYEKIYKTYNEDYLKFFRYENIENKPIKTILEIANFINYEINYKDAEEISLKYNKKEVKDLIKKNDENLLYKIKNKEEINKSSIVYFSKDNYRSFDTNTGFQTNHISNRNSGDWEKFFSSKEIEILNYEFKDFISEYKF